MPQYLVGILFHEPEPFAQWNRGLIEDYESSTGARVAGAIALTVFCGCGLARCQISTTS